MPAVKHLETFWLRRAAVAVLLASSASWAMAADPKAARFYEDALTRYDKRDYAGAIVQLKNALQVDRTLLSVQVLLGKALLANGDVIAAEVAFTEALRLGVNRAEVVVPLARAVAAQGKPVELIEQARFAVAGLPAAAQTELQLLRSVAFSDIGNPREAVKAIEEARAIDPASPDSWMTEVPVRIRARQFVEAIVAADKALGLATNNAEALYLRGSIAHAQDNPLAALASYDKALLADQQHVEALIARAGIYLDLGRPADAGRDIAVLRRVAPREPRAAYLQALLAEREGNATVARAALNDITALLDPLPIDFLRYRPQLLILGGLAHHGLGQPEKAKPYLEAAQRTQANSTVSKLLARIYLAENNVDRAIESLESYLRAQPADTQAIALLASAHMSRGRFSRATQLMQEALRSHESAQLRTGLGLSLARSNRTADAIAELEVAYRKDPGLGATGAALATLYLKGRQSKPALRVAEALVKRQPSNAGYHNLLGVARSAAGDTGGAKSAFEQASKIAPTFAEPQLNLARIEISAKNYDAAAGRLTALLAADEKQLDALMEFGLLTERRGQAAEAQRWFEKAADASGPRDLRAALELVDFHLRGARKEAALEASKRLTSLAPEDLQVLLSVARVLLANGDNRGAQTSLNRASRSASSDPVVLTRIALLQLQAGDMPGASYSVDKILSGQPDNLSALALMVDIDLRRGEPARAEQRAQQIATRYPKLAIGFSLQGDVASARGNLPTAVAAYRRAHQAEPSAESVMRLFRVLLPTDPAGAIQLADQWAKAHPKQINVRKAVGDVHAVAGRYPAARAAYEAVLQLSPDDGDTLNDLANVLILQKDPAALKMAERALSQSPGKARVIGTTGWAAYQAGQTERALQLLRDARLRDPANPDTRFFLATVLAQTGRKTEAREELESALRGGRVFASSKEAEALLKTLR